MEPTDEAQREALPPAAPGPAIRRPRWLGTVPAALLLVVSLWEIVATRCAATSAPDDAAWAEAAGVVREGYRDGDLIVFTPAWVDPVGRLHLGDLIPLDVAARMDAARFGRIWEVAIRDARAPETAGLSPVRVADRGGVAIRLYERTPVTVVADVRDLVATARTAGGGRPPALELAEVGFAPHRCLQVVPVAGQAMRVTFPGLPLGAELVGYVGIADVFTRRDQRQPAHLVVEVGGTQIAAVTAGVDDGWVRFAAPTTPGAADVTFVIRSDAPNRLVCFAAEARR